MNAKLLYVKYKVRNNIAQYVRMTNIVRCLYLGPSIEELGNGFIHTIAGSLMEGGTSILDRQIK